MLKSHAWVVCDKCRRTTVPQLQFSQELLRADARVLGWRYEDNLDLCPRCWLENSQQSMKGSTHDSRKK